MSASCQMDPERVQQDSFRLVATILTEASEAASRAMSIGHGLFATGSIDVFR